MDGGDQKEEAAPSENVEEDLEPKVPETTSEGFKVPTLALARPKTKSEGSASVEKTSTAEERQQSESISDSLPSPSSSSSCPAPLPPHPLPYNEPRWSAAPDEPYCLSMIKQGTIVQEVKLSDKPFHVFGRLPTCDVQLEHPSISRYHAVLQYRPREKGKGEGSEGTEEATPSSEYTPVSSVSVNPKEEGFYLYDLGSTHGSYVNKSKIQPRCYYRLRLGQMARFGGSSRLFLLESSGSGQEQVEAAAEEEIKEIVEHRERVELKRAELEAQQRLAEKEQEDMGVMWGIVTDDIPSMLGAAGEDYDIDEEKEAYYKDDPKKALKKFFDREGLELEYETEEEGPPRARIFTVRVRLPIDTATGEAVYAEASLKGKKKDAVIQCALNACRMLDAQDMLRHHAKAHKAKQKDWAENDYYDSDEDTFLDRTGQVERKRKNRMKKAGAFHDVGETHESLTVKLKETLTEIATIERRLAEDSKAGDDSNGVDSLDAYMADVGSHMDRGKRAEFKQRLHGLRNEKQKLEKLLKIAKSAKLPELKLPAAVESPPSEELKKRSCESDTTPLPASSPVPPQSTPLPSADKTAGSPANTPRTPTERERPPQPSPRRKKPRMMGPALPPPSLREDETEESSGLSHRDNTSNKKDEDAANYSDWLPPAQQTGDGRTHLNEKFGY